MAESMGTVERSIRGLYGSAATIYFCLPEVTMAGALSFGGAAILLLVTLVTGLPGAAQVVPRDSRQVADEFTA